MRHALNNRQCRQNRRLLSRLIPAFHLRYDSRQLRQRDVPVIHRRVAVRLAGLLPITLLCACVSTATNDELQRLRAENQQLRQQIQASNAAPAVAAPAAAAPAAAGSEAVVSAAPPAAAATPPAAVATPAPAAPPPAAALPQPPPGYALVKINPAHPHKAFDDTGCSDGWFGGPAGPDAPWKHQEQWDDLRRGMSMAQVEKILGEQHYETASGDRVSWQYGRCGHMSMSNVLFVDGRLAIWERPDR
jgi:prepilin-type processing-associated H-X9-DG protein